MLTKIGIAFALTAALAAAPLRGSVRSCIIYDAPLQKSCKMDCCANKKCCATSPKKTAPASQPLAKTDAAQQLPLSLPVASVGILPARSEHKHVRVGHLIAPAHSPPQLAVLCTFLI